MNYILLENKVFMIGKKKKTNPPAHLPGGVIMSTKTKSALKLPLKQHNMHTEKNIKQKFCKLLSSVIHFQYPAPPKSLYTW